MILLAAAGLRLPSHNWNQNLNMHPDEIYIVQTVIDKIYLAGPTGSSDFLDPKQSPLNPRAQDPGFAYGMLPFYLTKATGWLLVRLTGSTYFKDFDGTLHLGRILTALFDLLTVVLVFACGARLWGSAWGLMSAALYAFAILPIQNSHFFKSEPFATLFVTATLLFIIVYAQKGTTWVLALAGLATGFGAATKLNSATVIILPVAVIVAQAWQHRRDLKSSGAGLRGVRATALLGGTFLLAWFVTDPYALLDLPAYLTEIRAQAAAQNGVPDVVPTRKYVNTDAFYAWGQLAMLGIGPVAGLAATLGTCWTVVRGIRDRRYLELLLILALLVLFVPIALVESKWVRYLLPSVPVFCLLATSFCLSVFAMVKSRPLHNIWRGSVATVLIGSAVVGAIAYNALYSAPHTNWRASQWIFENVPSESHIGVEVDYVLPRALPEYPPSPNRYQIAVYDIMQDRPGDEALRTLQAHLSGMDYLIINTTRNLRTVPELPWRYPVMIRYYDLLFGGQLGYELVHTETSYPTIFGIEFKDDPGPADVSFTEYDHPPVWIFKKQRTLSDSEWLELFAEAIRSSAIPVRQAP